MPTFQVWSIDRTEQLSRTLLSIGAIAFYLLFVSYASPVRDLVTLHHLYRAAAKINVPGFLPVPEKKQVIHFFVISCY